MNYFDNNNIPYNNDNFNKYQCYFALVDNFEYKKNGVEETKDFIKFLLFDLLWKVSQK